MAEEEEEEKEEEEEEEEDGRTKGLGVPIFNTHSL